MCGVLGMMRFEFRHFLVGRRRRWFGHPSIAVGILIKLILDFSAIPSRDWFGPSVIKQAVVRAYSNIMQQARPTGPRFPFPAYFVQNGDQVQVLWFYTTSVPGQFTAADLGQLHANGWTLSGRMHFRQDQEHGLYHITSRRTWVSFPPYATIAEQGRMSNAFLAAYESLQPDHDLRSWVGLQEAHHLLSHGLRTEVTVLPLGYLRNVLALTLLALLFILPLRGRSDPWLRAWLCRRKPGHCPCCNYDTTGLTVCPECGTVAAARELNEPKQASPS